MAEASSVHPWVSSMAAVHQIYRSSFDAAPGYVASARGNDKRRALIANFYSNVLASLVNHHVGEDELYFPLLIERASEAEAEVVNLGQEEHEQVRAMVAAATASIAAWESSGDAEGAGLVRVLGALNDSTTWRLRHVSGGTTSVSLPSMP